MYALINQQDFFLTNFGFYFDGHSDAGRDEVEFSIQSRFQGLHPAGQDYLIQARPEGWQVNGTSISGARACASVCRGFNFTPNRIDVTMDVLNLPGYGDIDYELAADLVRVHMAKHNPKTAFTRSNKIDGLRRCVWGTRTSRWSLWLEEIQSDSRTGVRITWNMRQERVMQVYTWLNYFHTGIDYIESCKNAFAACTNTLLGPDFFGLNHPKEPILVPEKKADVQEDWWGYLSGVAQKIATKATKEQSQHLAVESVQFLEAEISKAVIRRAKEENELAIRIDRAGLSVVK